MSVSILMTLMMPSFERSHGDDLVSYHEAPGLNLHCIVTYPDKNLYHFTIGVVTCGRDHVNVVKNRKPLKWLESRACEARTIFSVCTLNGRPYNMLAAWLDEKT